MRYPSLLLAACLALQPLRPALAQVVELEPLAAPTAAPALEALPTEAVSAPIPAEAGPSENAADPAAALTPVESLREFQQSLGLQEEKPAEERLDQAQASLDQRFSGAKPSRGWYIDGMRAGVSILIGATPLLMGAASQSSNGHAAIAGILGAAAVGMASSFRRNSLDARYGREMSSLPLLTREQEHELAVANAREQEDFKKADKAAPPEERKASGRLGPAGAQLAAHNLRLVAKIAHEYKKYGFEVDDLVSVGNLGLIKGIEKLDPSRGFRLSTYAGWWIRAFIIRHIQDNWHLGHSMTNAAHKKLFYSLRRTQEEIEKEYGAEASNDPDFIAAFLNGPKPSKKAAFRPEDVARMLAVLHPVQSLDAPLKSDEAGRSTYLDHTPGNGPLQDEQFAAAQRQAILGKAVEDAILVVAQQDPRYEIMIRKRLMAEKPMTLEKIGDKYGLSRERIRQVEVQLIERLRAEIARNLEGTDLLEEHP